MTSCPTYDEEPLSQNVSSDPLPKRNMHKCRNKKHSSKAMLGAFIPLVASLFIGGWVRNTLYPNIQPIHVEQMPHASHRWL